MTRLDMTAREWHDLITPVLPHAAGKDDPVLDVIRLEAAGQLLHAVATDGQTLGAERHVLDSRDGPDGPERMVIHVARADAAASLKLFGYSKDEDPQLELRVDEVPVPLDNAGGHRTLGLRIDAPDGTRLVLLDRRDPGHDPLGSWRKVIETALARDLPQAAPALVLKAAHLPRWAKAVRKGERMAVYTGGDEGSPVLVLVEHHFAGIWKPIAYLDGAGPMLAESPWRADL